MILLSDLGKAHSTSILPQYPTLSKGEQTAFLEVLAKDFGAAIADERLFAGIKV